MLEFGDVIKGCASNNGKSKEMIYKAFYGYLMAVIVRYTNNRTDAEELVNDSFLKIFKAIHKFVPPADPAVVEKLFKAWIGKIASRTAIDFLRGRRIFVSMDEITEETEPLTQINVITELNVKDILKLLDDLPQQQRIIFNLYEIEGFSHSEISQLLNIPESSSRVYLVRSKQKLRALYANTLTSTYETN